MVGIFEMLWRLRFAVAATMVAASIGACAPRLQAPGAKLDVPHLTEEAYVTADGTSLKMSVWPVDKARRACAVIVALHGFNDYRDAFGVSAETISAEGITVMAYDQRGFGEDPNAGIWAGGETMAEDLRVFVGLVRRRYPETPVFVLGQSMGGAVALLAYGTNPAPAPDVSPEGLILVAPAVWGWSSMNAFYSAGLWLAAHTIPGHRLTGKSLNIKPSDNIEMLRGQARDPLVIKKTRIDSVYGLVNLMDDALDVSADVRLPVFLLYGQNDEVIPKEPMRKLRARLSDQHIFQTYETGYHMLLRDNESARPIRDITDFVLGRPTTESGLVAPGKSATAPDAGCIAGSALAAR